ARAPLGSMALDPIRYEVTVLMPKGSVVELSAMAPWATETPRGESGCAPSWYGPHTCWLGVAWLRNAARWSTAAGRGAAGGAEAGWLRGVGVPLLGGVMVVVTVPVCGVVVLLVTLVFTVSAALDRSAASAWLTWELPTESAPSVRSWTGNWMPVLLSGGIWV